MSNITIARLVFWAFMGVILMSIPSKAGTPRSGYAAEQDDIETPTAGQILHQPAAEEKWQNQLSSLPALQGQNLDYVSARNTITAAQAQKPLVETFTRNIWSQLSASSMPTQPVKFQERSVDPYTGVHLFIFVSESVPKATLTNYLRDAEGLGAVFVLRGVLGDNPSHFERTRQWVQSLLCPSDDMNDCSTIAVDINPNLYKLYDIRVVPTIVYTADIINTDENFATGEKFDKTLSWEGDTSLHYVLDRFKKERPLDHILSSYISSQVKMETKAGGI